jgi:hypothetical protein
MLYNKMEKKNTTNDGNKQIINDVDLEFRCIPNFHNYNLENLGLDF